MLKKHLKEHICQNLGFEPTTGQNLLSEKLADFIANGDPDELFLLKGYAGTGKTSMLNALVKTLRAFRFQTVLLAPTGRAAKVLASYTGQSAFTIHKKIYRQQSTTDGFGKFMLDKNLAKNCFFIVDEASMISNSSAESSVFGSGRLLDDLYEYVHTGANCKLVLVGDTAQLPPVGMEMSPALDVSELEMYGSKVMHHELVDVVRQALDSGILYNATQLRSLINEPYFQPAYFPIELSGFNDIQRIGGAELIDKISDCYDKYGEQQTMVITRSNKRANRFNEGIRSTILYKEADITIGDLLMVVKNNYFWLGDDKRLDFIANGDIVEIQSIYNYEELYGFRFANVCLKFIDYDDLEIDCKIILETLNIETASLGYEQSQRLFQAVAEDYADIRSKKKRWEKIKENEYFNALQVKFAYAVTCHKAQGGQWDAVFVDQGYLVEDRLDVEYLRWLYTAFTRPVKELFLVNFNKEFFETKVD
ncbi:ATP-dependent DNA helicase [Sunxiuqinia dokdonensis]|uniref:ATP-dependent endonuclease n=1 Tax=Sunxiuqinia dokdonensis TaxID=1409788 RepID=A0A0L8V9Q8_9BACT|nr:AAA family ATPase [Sunxiuqinia dokdonensis]KOH45176.1 ATP-dependent endonuclease [Sunxiuqinia dokdonensis]